MDMLLIPCPKCGRELRLRDMSLLGKQGKCPKCAHRFVLQPPSQLEDEVQFELVDAVPTKAPVAAPALGTGAQWVPDAAPHNSHAQPAAAPAPVFVPEIPAIATVEQAGVQRLKEIKRKNRQRTKIGVAMGAVIALALGGVLFATQRIRDSDAAKKVPQTHAGLVAEKETLKENFAIIKENSPTKGAPLQLLYMPNGARIVISIHPSVLWQEGTVGEEFRFCLGPLGVWAGDQIKQHCLFEPKEIEHALICLMLNEKGVPPSVSAVVKLTEEKKKSELLLMLQGNPVEDFGPMIYVGEDRSYMIHDLKTIAIVPKGLEAEMANAIRFPNPTDQGIENLIHYTDRDRYFTLLFNPVDFRTQQDSLFPVELRPFVNQVVDWLGEDVETVAWSLHFDKRNFQSDILLRNKNATTPRSLERDFQKKLDALPEQVLGGVQKMNPEKYGHRLIIGRFPAMMQAVSTGTLGGIGDSYVQLSTRLDERAAPNLAAGAFMTWYESLRTDFTKTAPTTTEPAAGPKLTIAQRLDKSIEIDFRRVPLQDAFAYISDESKIPIKIDGDALKLSGYTQNMPQTMNLGGIPGKKAIFEILKQYEQMCIIVDEANNLVTVMTKPVAADRGLTPYSVGP